MNKSERNRTTEKNPEEKKKTERGRRTRLEIEVGGFKPLCATQADPGRMRPKLEAHTPGSAWGRHGLSLSLPLI